MLRCSPRLIALHQLAVTALLAWSLGGCGRIGVELLPRDEGLSPGDGGMRDGASPAEEDGATRDAATEPNDADASQAEPCETPCENAHGSATCETGTCVIACETGYADCDGDVSNGCEADIANQSLSCGACTLSCTNPNGESLCSGGLCTPSCAANFADCDGDPANGCEADLGSVESCGACAIGCSNAHGTTSCVAGACASVCAAGYADCDGERQNGCEANIESDPMRCGACGRTCGSNGQICVDGTCQASPCATGLAECDGDQTVTCETNTTSSVADCGFCDNVCTVANGTPRCASSTCAIASCNSGYADCDANVSSGCEVRLATSTANCGACGAACTNAHGSTTCVDATCQPICGSGWGDCDGSRPNGCETSLNTVGNCGACGRSCPANGGTAVCNAGVCGTICDLSGTFALKVTHQTSWPSNDNIRSGSGTHVYWLRMQGTQRRTTINEVITECGRVVPDFSASAVSETYKFHLPNSLFDGNYLPSTAADVALGSSSPGASLMLPSTALLIGTTMTDPVNGSWPTSASGLTRVDADRDAKPGATFSYLNGGGYEHPRVDSSLFSSRAERPYSATRLVFSLNGTLNSCTQSSGSATVSHIDTRIFGCDIAGSTRDCSSSEANFLDQNCLRYTVGSASYSLVKVADGASCAQVRAALP